MSDYYSSKDFEEKFTYDGKLGAEWSAEKTFFRLWAPTANKAFLRLYKNGDASENDLIEEIPMERDVFGTWIFEKYGDLNGIYYTFSVLIGDIKKEAPDPYGKAVGVNGNRSMVIDLSKTNPNGWENDKGVFYEKGITDAVIYELHIRDFSMDESSGIKNKGKFLGLTETDTKTKTGISTGLDHIKELGITHIHLLPCFDFGSVDESDTENAQYNWGYDPVNFNVPEGSYSTSAKNAKVRIAEMKTAIKVLHENKIGVIMDMVYNHVYKKEDFCINALVPGYFSRTYENGKYSNGSGCGNDTATERSMVRKYIVDSVKFWADEYHIDGFRFDLSGLIDIATINEITADVHPKHPNVIFYGEGWDMSTVLTKDGIELANKNNSEKTPGCSYFSDTLRDFLVGNNFEHSDLGLVTGKKGLEHQLKQCFRGMNDWCKTPSKSINYVSCHDGLTLFDRISKALPQASFNEKIRRNNLAAAIYMLSQGVPFLQAGEEMLRSKVLPDGSFDDNSYKSPDSVNSIKWSELEKNEHRRVFEYYKGLICFRKNHNSLRINNPSDVYSHISDVETGICGVEAFHIWGNVNGETAEAILAVFNTETDEKEIILPVGEWSVRIFDEKAGDEHLFFAKEKIKIPPLSSAVMIK